MVNATNGRRMYIAKEKRLLILAATKEVETGFYHRDSFVTGRYSENRRKFN